MLPIVLSQEQIDTIAAESRDGSEAEIDLEEQVIRRKNGETIPFDVEPFRRHCLINGLDDISLTLAHEADISVFEEMRTEKYPWLNGIGYSGKIPVAQDPSKPKKMEW